MFIELVSLPLELFISVLFASKEVKAFLFIELVFVLEALSTNLVFRDSVFADKLLTKLGYISKD